MNRPTNIALRLASVLLLIGSLGLGSCSKSSTNNPVAPTSNSVKQLTLGSQFLYTYSLLDSNFAVEPINATSTYTVTQVGASLFGKTNVSALRFIRTASNLGIDPDSTLLLVAVESNGDVSYLDTNGAIGWITLPITSKATTTIPPTDTSADGNGVISSGTVQYVGTSTITVGTQTVSVVTCHVTVHAYTYYVGTLERSESDDETILFAPDLGFMMKNVDQATFTGAIGNLNTGGYQQVATGYSIK